MSVLNLIYSFYAIPIKIPTSYFMDMDKPMLKFTWRDKRPKNSQHDIEEKNKVGGLTLPVLKNYYKATIIKTVW